MNHLEKFINQILLGEETAPVTKKELASAEGRERKKEAEKKAPHPKSPAGKLAKAAEARTRVKPAKYFGGKSKPQDVDTKAAIERHRADIYAAGKKAGPVEEPQNDSFDPALAYKQMGKIISEVLTPKQHADATGGGEEAAETREKRIKAVRTGKNIGDISAMRSIGKKGVSLSKGAEKQAEYRKNARKKGSGLKPEPRGGRFG
jgi:hypothetical protein